LKCAERFTKLQNDNPWCKAHNTLTKKEKYFAMFMLR
jgi:hypothetical protein